MTTGPEPDRGRIGHRDGPEGRGHGRPDALRKRLRRAERPARGGVLDRIRIDRTHSVASIDPVNPVYIYKVEQIHGR